MTIGKKTRGKAVKKVVSVKKHLTDEERQTEAKAKLEVMKEIINKHENAVKSGHRRLLLPVNFIMAFKTAVEAGIGEKGSTVNKYSISNYIDIKSLKMLSKSLDGIHMANTFYDEIDLDFDLMSQ